MLKVMNGLLLRGGTGVNNCIIRIEMNVTGFNRETNIMYRNSEENRAKNRPLRQTFHNIEEARFDYVSTSCVLTI